MASGRSIATSLSLTLETLSPLHVGAGTARLLADYDFVADRGRVWVIDQAKMLNLVSDEALEGNVEPRISRLLRPGQYSGCARYSLLASGGNIQAISEQIKDAEGRPYVPGSSLKGAVRSALGWAMYGRSGLALRQLALGRSAEHAGSPIERRLFGSEPNRDLLRALAVSDLGGLSTADLELAVVATYTLRSGQLQPKGPGFRFWVEVVPAGRQLQGTLRIDEYILGPAAAALGLEGCRGWLADVAKHGRERAAALVAGELELYRRARLPRPAAFYDGLKKMVAGLGPDELLLQMSWGTGWRAKTLDSRLTADPDFQRVRDDYRLGYRGLPFPKSRRLVERGNVAETPLGWVKVRLSA